MSQQYTDNEGRTWSLQIDVGALRRIRADTGLKAAAFSNKASYEKLAEDPELFVDVLWAIVRPEATRAGVTPEQFAHGLLGDVIDQAGLAFCEALIDFFPTRKAKVFRRAQTHFRNTMETMEQKALDAAEKDIERLEKEFASKTSSTTSPASSASTPDR